MPGTKLARGLNTFPNKITRAIRLSFMEENDDKKEEAEVAEAA
jgi:hypothetical protein